MTSGNNEDRRAEAFRILNETCEGVEADASLRDNAFLTLINTSETRDEMQEVADLVRIARLVEFEDAGGNSVTDLRPAVREAFIRACTEAGHEDIVEDALVDKPRKANPPPASWNTLLNEERAEWRRKAHAHHTSPAA